MSPFSVKLDADELACLLEGLAKRRADAVIRLDQATADIAKIDARVAVITTQVNESASITSPSGRVKRGESEKLIRQFLQGANGTGATVNNIVAGINSSYGTVYRALQDLLKSGEVSKNGSRWSWLHKEGIVTSSHPPSV